MVEPPQSKIQCQPMPVSHGLYALTTSFPSVILHEAHLFNQTEHSRDLSPFNSFLVAYKP